MGQINDKILCLILSGIDYSIVKWSKYREVASQSDFDNMFYRSPFQLELENQSLKFANSPFGYDYLTILQAEIGAPQC